MGFLDRFSKDSAAAPDGFTIEVVARIRALPDVARAEAVDADTVEVVWRERPEPEVIDISGPRRPWKQAKGFDRIELLDDFMAALGPGRHAPVFPGEDHPAVDEPVTEWSQVAAQLVPVLRRVRPDDDAITWPIGDLLEATAVWAGAAAPVTAAQCNTWGIGLDEARSAATANLMAIDPAPDPIGPAARAWVPTSPEGLQSSWLAAPRQVLDRLDMTTAIVLAPLRSELVIVDPEDTDLVQSILANTLAILESQSGCLCPVPFLVTGDHVESWMPAPDHPAAELVRQTRDILRS